MTGRQWSEQQQSVFGWFENGRGNLVVRARAGTGKTTTIINALAHAPERDTLLAAFNKRIADELKRKVQAAGSFADVKTLHGVGFSIVQRYWERCTVDSRRGFDLAKRACGDDAPDEMIGKVQKLAGLAKGALTGFPSGADEAAKAMLDYLLSVDKPKPEPGAEIDAVADLLLELAERFDIEPDQQWQEDGWTVDRIVWLAMRALESARHREPEGPPRIDFDDMLFLPLANGWAKPRYTLVVIDEAQDMSASQLELARRVSTSWNNPDAGRIVVVGDDRQAIYGFRGADSTAIDRLKRELSATELPLTRTYRCGKRIVEYARKIVPDFLAADTNGEGTIEAIHETQLVATATAGDFVLSRKNAPLVSVCLKLLKAGKPARIEGKDIAAGLKAIVRRWKPRNMTALIELIQNWREREIAKNEKKNTPAALDKIEEVKDKAEILLALCEGLAAPAELLTRLDTLFGDTEDDRRPSVVCSSIHRSKGLEASRVFVLKHTLYPRRQALMRKGLTEAKAMVEANDSLEEANLEYVAVTRAIDRLVWVMQ